MKTFKTIFLALLINFHFIAFAQVAISNDGSVPDSSAILDIKSSNSGVLLPRLTSLQRDAINSPAEGLLIFNTDVNAIQYFDGSAWKISVPGSCIPPQPSAITGNGYPECNQSGVIYSIDEITEATSYYWTIPPDAAITNGQGTTTITVDMGTQSGYISVRSVSGCGQSDSATLSISIGIPDQPGDIAGSSLPEPNASGKIYSIDPVNGATSYNWIVPQNSTIVNGQGTTSITVDFDTIPGNVSVRAENSCGNSDYTNLPIIFFTCGEQFTDTRDGKTYSTVSIGNQCWFAENLNVGTRINANNYQTNNEIIEKYCYNNEEDSCDVYGGLYQWNEMMQYTTTQGTQGICPDGWHIPSDNEWKTLEMQLGMSQSAANSMGGRGTDEGKKMKSTSSWNNNGNGTNSSGFNGLPGGSYYNGFSNVGNRSYWWTSSLRYNYYPWYRKLHYDSDQIFRNPWYKSSGHSIRCLKN